MFIHSARFRRVARDVHAGNQTVAKLVRMVDGGVDKEVAFYVVDDLVHFNDPLSVFARLNADWLDVRIERYELP